MFTRKNALCSMAVGILMAATAGMASAAETASATIAAATDGAQFKYTIDLTNTSTDGSDIGTFWFSWIPGVDYMEAKPTLTTAPTGWVSPISGSNNFIDGNAIENFDVGGPADLITPGQTGTFTFDSTEPLSQILGPSTHGAHLLETTAFVYAGGPETDAGFEFNVTAAPVPEPVSASMLAIAGGGLLMRRRRA